MYVRICSAADIRTTADPAWIQSVLRSGSTEDRRDLTRNEHLSPQDFDVLARDPDDDVREAVAGRRAIPAATLSLLAADPSERVRAQAIGNRTADPQAFAAAVLGGKFSSRAISTLCDSLHAASDTAVFEYLWSKKKSERGHLLRKLHTAATEGFPLDPRIPAFVAAEIQDQANGVREVYAMIPEICDPAALDRMKDDTHRPVINAIAGNPKAWVSTHEYLAGKHKTPAVRISIAKATTDAALLGRIHAGTKSAQIHAAVEANPAFTTARTVSPIVPFAAGGAFLIDEEGACFESVEALEAAGMAGDNTILADFDGMDCEAFTEDNAQAVRALIEKHGLAGCLKVVIDEDLGYYTLLGTAPGSQTHCYLNLDDETNAAFDADTPGTFILELLQYLASVGGPGDGSTDLLHSVYKNGHIIWGIEDVNHTPFTWKDVELLLNS
ncbi:hypothetical protein [Arthrobacter caoxuetaonis]|uniref:Uncharacterized protein n=1 Tax=Arthrobacter caoxuetaonis TaxID=2886935 RepID=A0A9X1MGY8_9MICC|nr:hypothetical protein [Arthrobacter caoxuetaonis]MCC3299416.1 hypothetical protein [Arthrobacter caoxuetaonis]USQ59091.1 hypothetical protein NF551_18470 [Arthrobacter caoxuetaonis]